jgi:hypothetical protein
MGWGRGRESERGKGDGECRYMYLPIMARENGNRGWWRIRGN